MVSIKSLRTVHTTDRVGVSWRKDSCVVEMRPPHWTHRKLHFGSYRTEVEAMIARDYGALLRISAGEDGTSAGGFDVGTHPSMYEFEESFAIFTGMETFKTRCAQFRRLASRYQQQPKGTWSPTQKSPFADFCVEARNDIAIAINEFRRRYPHKFVNCWRAPEAVVEDMEKLDGSFDSVTRFSTPPSSFEVGSYQSREASSSASNKPEVEQQSPEYHSENVSSGTSTFSSLPSYDNGDAISFA